MNPSAPPIPFSVADIDKNLTELLRSIAGDSDGAASGDIAKIVETGSNDEDLVQFVNRIVQDVVVGPVQESFSGQEIIDAVNQKKATSFLSAFQSLSKKILEISMHEGRDEMLSTGKDFRDIFSLSVLISTIMQDYSQDKSSLLKAFFSGADFDDESNKTFHESLLEYFYQMGEDDPGINALPMMFQAKFYGFEGGDHLKWTKPVNIDSLFNY